MKVKVKKLPTRRGMAGLDAWFYWFIGRMPGEVFQRVCLQHGRERLLFRPSRQGEDCPSNGEHPGIDCRCDNCDYALRCSPKLANVNQAARTWDNTARTLIPTPPRMAAFFTDIVAAYKKHGLSLAHEDGQGAFIVENYSEENLAWLLEAQKNYE